MEMGASLAKKVMAVMSAITGIEKEGFNEHFKYKFAAEADVLRVVRTAMVDAGLICLPSVLSVDQLGSRTKTTMQYTLVDTETGESYTAAWSGESEDKQDKGISKAITSAGKYFLLKLFLIPTGDDPDADGPAKPTPAAKPAAKAPVKEPPAHAVFLRSIEMDERQLADFKAAYPNDTWKKWAIDARDAKVTTVEGLYSFIAQAPVETK